jgi:hypothetical protein
MLYKATYYCIDPVSGAEVNRAMLVPADNSSHAADIVKAFDKSACVIRLETMPDNSWRARSAGRTPPATKPSSGELLARLGIKAELWAPAFCEQHGGHLDKDMVLAWFANAIEAGWSAGWDRGREEERSRWADAAGRP